LSKLINFVKLREMKRNTGIQLCIN